VGVRVGVGEGVLVGEEVGEGVGVGVKVDVGEGMSVGVGTMVAVAVGERVGASAANTGVLIGRDQIKTLAMITVRMIRMTPTAR